MSNEAKTSVSKKVIRKASPRKVLGWTKSSRILHLPVPRSSQVSRSYLLLAAAYPLRPIRSNDDLDEAIAVLDKLLGRRRPLDSHEQGYLESLSNEIQRYEATAYPMPKVSDAAMLRHLIEAKGATLSKVAEETGIAISTLSAVSTGKRHLNRKHIEVLAAYFGVAPGVFLE